VFFLVFLVLEKYDIWLLFQPLWSYAGHWLEWVGAHLAKKLFFGERLEMEFQVGDLIFFQGDFSGFKGQIFAGFLALAYSHKENLRQVVTLRWIMKTS
jgi:hypothetical protein